MTLFLHAGISKTGTTSLQRTLAASRDALAAHGYGYAALAEGPEFNHHGLVAAARRSPAALAALLDGAFARPPHHAIFSSELLQQLSEAEKRALVDALAVRHGPPRVILYVRHPVDWAVSQAQQAIKMRQRTFEETCAAPPMIQFRPILTEWETLVGRAAMTVRVFAPDALRAGDVVDDFLAEIGAAAALPDLARVRANESISLPAARVLSALIRLERARKLPSKVALGPIVAMKGARFALPDWSIGYIQAVTRGEVDWLAEHWGIRFDNAPRFTPPHDDLAETFARMLLGLEGTLAQRAGEIEALRTQLRG